MIRTLRIVRWTAIGLIVLVLVAIAVIEIGPAGIFRQARSTTDSTS